MSIAGKNISPVQLKKMKNLHDQGVPMDQILSQIFTNTGETLAKAINDYNNNLTYSDPNNQYQSSVTTDDLNNLMNSYSASAGSSNSFGLSGWAGALFFLIVLFFMWQSEPGGRTNKSSSGTKLKNNISI